MTPISMKYALVLSFLFCSTVPAAADGHDSPKSKQAFKQDVNATVQKAPEPFFSFATGLPVTSLSAMDNRGTVHGIAVSHGEKGLAVYRPAGEKIWVDPRPSLITASYGGVLLSYNDPNKHGEANTETDSQETILTRYKVIPPSFTIRFVQNDSPSPIAPTTLQRSSLFPVGPIRIDGSRITFVSFKDGNEMQSHFDFDQPVTAVAGTFQFARKKSIVAPDRPIGPVFFISFENGDIRSYDACLFKPNMKKCPEQGS